MANLKVNLGDFEVMQLILKAFNFECVSDDKHVYKRIYRKNDVDVVITKYTKDD